MSEGAKSVQVEQVGWVFVLILNFRPTIVLRLETTCIIS